MKNPKNHKLHTADYISLTVLLVSCLGIWLLLSGSVKYAILCGGVAFVLDALDGYIARKLGQTSDFGKQLDSMIDIINYPVFSALFIQLVLMPNIWGALVGFFVIATAILRLIRFNDSGFIKQNGKLYYRGLIVCHMSLIVALLVLLTKFISVPPIIIAIVILVAASLQLSSIKTRKTDALYFWVPVAIAIGAGALLWL